MLSLIYFQTAENTLLGLLIAGCSVSLVVNGISCLCGYRHRQIQVKVNIFCMEMKSYKLLEMKWGNCIEMHLSRVIECIVLC